VRYGQPAETYTNREQKVGSREFRTIAKSCEYVFKSKGWVFNVSRNALASGSKGKSVTQLLARG